jgi:hypothetical protein
MDHQESPTFCESGKRRLVLEDFYKFYKSLDRKVAAKLFKEISSRLYARWHVIIIQKTIFYPLSIEKGGKGCVQKIILREITLKIRVMMWKFLNFFPFTSEHGYLVVFLWHLIVHGPEEALVCNSETKLITHSNS